MHSFNVHGVIFVGNDGAYFLVIIEIGMMGFAEVIAPIEKEIRQLANALKAVQDEQEYIVVRERRHRDTAESTNSRVKWWAIIQAVVLLSVVAFQVYYLKVRVMYALSDQCV